MNERQWIHAMGRLGFGANGQELNKTRRSSIRRMINAAHRKAEKEPGETLRFEELENYSLKDLKNINPKELIEKSTKALLQLNTNWVKRMIRSDNPIQEQMNLFWHHHFACEINNPIFAREFSNMVRKHSLGNFRNLLMGVSKSAAMIAYLNTRQNKKQNPNEDFARELCELFTLGEGNGYTEHDIQEIARAFTGWNHDFKGNYRFRKRMHDRNSKSIFGNKGNYGGEDVIDLILEKRECASFIALNMYEYFVNPYPHKDHVVELAKVLYDSNYNIKTTMIHLAESEWFYDEKNFMTIIKSPIELLIGMGRHFRLDSNNELSWIVYQQILNQVLYRPPNVAGWKVNKEWINSNSLSLRLRFPSIMLSGIQINPDDEEGLDSEMADQRRKGIKAITGFSSDWKYFFKVNEGYEYTRLFFNDKLSVPAKETIQNMRYRTEKERVLQLMSLPEYQMV